MNRNTTNTFAALHLTTAQVFWVYLCSLLVLLAMAPAASASPSLQTASPSSGATDSQGGVILRGNTRPDATAANDRGKVLDSMPLDSLVLVLRRSASSEASLQKFLGELQDRQSPTYHQWLTPEEFGKRFGLSDSELDRVTSWLSSSGFKVNRIYKNRVTIAFSGTAGMVSDAFHTEIHNLDVNGERHFANISDPSVPAGLAPYIAGVSNLNDFKPHKEIIPRRQYTVGGGDYLVVPSDLATIYNLSSTFQAGTSGQGQTIDVIEDSDVYSTTDWSTFRSTFGLSGYSSGAFTQVHPSCTDPGANYDDDEAILDAEWASAAAPSASIVLASCSGSGLAGVLEALQNVVDGSSLPSVLSVSYGVCETEMGSSTNQAFSTAYEQGVAEGISSFVAAGDANAATCDRGGVATDGIGVNGVASSPYDTAVGGTDFYDTALGETSTYWSSSNNSYYGSALSYVPEIPWNDACASSVLAQYNGYSTGYGSAGFCNNLSPSQYYYLETIGGGGGPSGCATGSSGGYNRVGGTCAGWSKPSYQSVFGNPSDGVRDLPDLSLFAANGVFGHYYVFCDSGAGGCTGAPDNWSGAGGTSFASPIMAGIQALYNQAAHSTQGNANTLFYNLGSQEYGTSGNSSCNSTLGNGVGSSCVFRDITAGDIATVCDSSYDCYLPSGTYGALSTSDSSFHAAYGAASGWDFATGLGSINAGNYVATAPPPGPWEIQINRGEEEGCYTGFDLFILQETSTSSLDWYFYLYTNDQYNVPVFSWTLSDSQGTIDSGNWSYSGNGEYPPFSVSRAPVGVPTLSINGYYEDGCYVELYGSGTGYYQ